MFLLLYFSLSTCCRSHRMVSPFVHEVARARRLLRNGVMGPIVCQSKSFLENEWCDRSNSGTKVLQKIHIRKFFSNFLGLFWKKGIFSRFYLVISEKSSTFAPDFGRNGVLAHLARARHWQCRGERFESAILHNFSTFQRLSFQTRATYGTISWR